MRPLGLDLNRDGFISVPSAYNPDRPPGFVLMLHGAGGNGRDALEPMLDLAAARNLILLAPDSRAGTWDVIREGFGPDVTFIDQALDYSFSRYMIDPAHIAVEGFSDGASYALSLGPTNGDLFTHIIAFSPGFMAPAEQHGKPPIFISHGTHDTVLPIQQCSRVIVPRLERAGYSVDYREFDSPHIVSEAVAIEALNWFLT